MCYLTLDGAGQLCVAMHRHKKKDEDSKDIEKMKMLEQALMAIASGGGTGNLDSVLSNCMASLKTCETDMKKQIAKLQGLEEKLLAASGGNETLQNLAKTQMDRLIEGAKNQLKSIDHLIELGSTLKGQGPAAIEHFTTLAQTAIKNEQKTGQTEIPASLAQIFKDILQEQNLLGK